jgi:hypothetical protein
VLVDKLIFHQFGNYVLQKIISVVQSQSLRVMVLQRVYQLSGELQKTKHGMKVLQKLQKTYASIMSSFQNIGLHTNVTSNNGFNNYAGGVFSPNRIQSGNNQHSHSAGGYNGNNNRAAAARKFAHCTVAAATY